MKWFEVISLVKGESIIRRLGSDRPARFIEAHDEMTRTIIVTYLDDRSRKKERVQASEFYRPKAPAGTVPRTNDSS